MLSLNLSQINKPVTPGEIDELYKDLNPIFREDEAAFVSFMRYIKNTWIILLLLMRQQFYSKIEYLNTE